MVFRMVQKLIPFTFHSYFHSYFLFPSIFTHFFPENRDDLVPNGSLRWSGPGGDALRGAGPEGLALDQCRYQRAISLVSTVQLPYFLQQKHNVMNWWMVMNGDEWWWMVMNGDEWWWMVMNGDESRIHTDMISLRRSYNPKFGILWRMSVGTKRGWWGFLNLSWSKCHRLGDVIEIVFRWLVVIPHMICWFSQEEFATLETTWKT